jgi:hypothetical protein
MNAREDACRALLAAVLFTDECAIYRSVHSRNIVFWAKENLHFLRKAGEKPTSRYGVGWTDCNTHVWPFLLPRLRYRTGLTRHA